MTKRKRPERDISNGYWVKSVNQHMSRMIQEEVEAFERFELLEDADYDLPGSPELGDTVSFGAAPKTPLTPFQSLQEQEPINGLGGLRVSPLLRYRIK